MKVSNLNSSPGVYIHASLEFILIMEKRIQLVLFHQSVHDPPLATVTLHVLSSTGRSSRVPLIYKCLHMYVEGVFYDIL